MRENVVANFSLAAAVLPKAMFVQGESAFPQSWRAPVACWVSSIHRV
jgi:hypothetical protein